MTALDYLLVWLGVSLMCGLTIAACARYARRAEAAESRAARHAHAAEIDAEAARLYWLDIRAKARECDEALNAICRGCAHLSHIIEPK